MRDLEVQRDRLRAHAGRLPAPEAENARRVVRRLDADRAAARADLLAMLDERRYEQLRAKVAAAAASPAYTKAAAEPAEKALKKVVRKRWKQIRHAVDDLGKHPPDEALHAIRVRAKKARYAAEACAPAFGKPARRFARAMANVQEILGEHHDAVVAVEWLTKTAHECSPAEAYAIGMLAQIEREAAAAARAAFPAAWRRADSDARPRLAVSDADPTSCSRPGASSTRSTPDGAVQFLVVHRPRYDDWSIPKGKLEPGESLEDAAHREIQEETGLLVELGASAARTASTSTATAAPRSCITGG